MSSDGRWSQQYRRHKTNRAMQKRSVMTGSFVKKKRPTHAEPKFKAYRWGDEEEELNYRVRDPVVRSNFFLVPAQSPYDHYFAGLEPLLYGSRSTDTNENFNSEIRAMPKATPPQTTPVDEVSEVAQVIDKKETNLENDAQQPKRKVVKRVKAKVKKPQRITFDQDD
ncbi:hypothetical protein DIPPA_60607 [Diplonema papillatum]|nr:hypothetical protein DIPPA_60607 [Diplonema papillatum]